MGTRTAEAELADVEALDRYFDRLTDAETDQAAKFEEELNAYASEGFSARAILALLQVIPAIQKLQPKATVEGIYEMALIRGAYSVLGMVESQTGRPDLLTAPKRKARKSGARLVR